MLLSILNNSKYVDDYSGPYQSNCKYVWRFTWSITMTESSLNSLPSKSLTLPLKTVSLFSLR